MDEAEARARLHSVSLNRLLIFLCPVQAACASWAGFLQNPLGVWGTWNCCISGPKPRYRCWIKQWNFESVEA